MFLFNFKLLKSKLVPTFFVMLLFIIVPTFYNVMMINIVLYIIVMLRFVTFYTNRNH